MLRQIYGKKIIKEIITNLKIELKIRTTKILYNDNLIREGFSYLFLKQVVFPATTTKFASFKNDLMCDSKIMFVYF